MPKKHISPGRGKRSKYTDPVTRTIIMEREDWDFAHEYGFKNSTLGIQRALHEVRKGQDHDR